jgi:hypothetical protein
MSNESQNSHSRVGGFMAIGLGGFAGTLLGISTWGGKNPWGLLGLIAGAVVGAFIYRATRDRVPPSPEGDGIAGAHASRSSRLMSAISFLVLGPLVALTASFVFIDGVDRQDYLLPAMILGSIVGLGGCLGSLVLDR